jgi:aldehyde dehydrogenase (NAD+)
MQKISQFYINGEWVEPLSTDTISLVDPYTLQEALVCAMGNEADTNRAVEAAKRAFPSWSQSHVEERLSLIERVIAEMSLRHEHLAVSLAKGMGMPISAARTSGVQVPIVMAKGFADALRTFRFREYVGTTLNVKQPIGVCGLITPWNWPLGQIVQKVFPAIAAGCTMILKPSEMTPLDAIAFAEAIHAAGVPPGVFNLVLGAGSVVGARLASHPDVPLISITSSTTAGVAVAQAGARFMKRVAAELGGKSANVLLDDVDLRAAVDAGVRNAFRNCGQSCSAPTRMLVPASQYEEAKIIARETANSIKLGAPMDESTEMGPIAFQLQFDRIQRHISNAIDEGAELIAGGLGNPETHPSSLYPRPTVFGVKDPKSRIAQEEVFGPVLVIQPYSDDAEALEIANGTAYGLGGYVQSASLQRAREFALKMHTGTVNINGSPLDWNAPFGGVKMSGIGRERGLAGLEEYLEIKSIIGYGTVADKEQS